MKLISVLIDGGHLRVLARKAGKTYDPDFIERYALKCKGYEEEIYRVLYYDCAPYNGKAKLPVSGTEQTFKGSDQWLVELSKKDLFAVRRGILKFRGFKPKKIPISPQALQDSDFVADFEQKGVDMRIGLDIALYAENKAVQRIALITNDTDCIPAMKHGRKSGLQVILIEVPGANVAPELLSHADFKRPVDWP